MPGKVKVRILAGRNLPVMDRASETSDAYVEVKFGNTTYKTDVYRKSLNPQWNSEWFRFEVDDEELQDEPLQIRIMDHDTYSANDAIGKVYIDLNPLLAKDSAAVISGWFPIYDTMHGIRGELHAVVKVDLFTDFNRFRQSSCGVQFFFTSGIPYGYRVQAIQGFVEELVVNDDPEYQWIDKIRTPRASNETRQTLFSKLSGELQRKVGLKVLEMGGNAVLGYMQCFDLEGESGIVVRGIGTAVSLIRHPATNMASPHSPSPNRHNVKDNSPTQDDFLSTHSPTNLTPTKLPASPGKGLQRRLSESDLCSSTTKGGNLSDSWGSSNKACFHRPTTTQQNIDMFEYPFLTMRHFPSDFVEHLGGVVSARSVKLLDRIHNPDEPETRDTWWTEVRMEIRSHARAMGCHAVLGYRETTSICGEICVLSAYGTAANINLHIFGDNFTKLTPVSNTEKSHDRVIKIDIPISSNQLHHHHPKLQQRSNSEGADENHLSHSPHSQCCHAGHIPYNTTNMPFPVNLGRCLLCKQHQVPDVLFTTIEPLPDLAITGRCCLIQARICRAKKEAKGENNAKEIGDSLPFLEYELHRQLLNKLKVKGMNALFGLCVSLSIGEKMLIGAATGTAIYLSSLHSPTVPKILGKSSDDMQKKILDTVKRNQELYGLTDICEVPEQLPKQHDEENLPDLDLSVGNKDAYVLELDDAEDADIISLLIDPPLPSGVEVCNIEHIPGLNNISCNLQLFTRVWRGKLSPNQQNNKYLSQLFDVLICSIIFKLRKMKPFCLCNISFDVEIPDEDQVLVSVIGMSVGLGENHPGNAGALELSKNKEKKDSSEWHTDHVDELMFKMDLHGSDHTWQPICSQTSVSSEKSFFDSGTRLKDFKKSQKIEIDLTSLSYIPGARIDRYLGNLNFFFIRESTSIREYGGLSGFMQSFITEVLAIVRAHVASLGGNALVSYRMSECVLLDNPHKNQGQCLINVSGDVVQMVSESDHPMIDILHKGSLQSHSLELPKPCKSSTRDQDSYPLITAM